MRRVLVVLSSLALVTAWLTPPAAAADRTVVVHGPEGFDGDLNEPGTVGLSGSSCTLLGELPSAQGFYVLRPTDDPLEPLGTTKFGFQMDDSDGAVGPLALVDTDGSSSWRARVQSVESSLRVILVASVSTQEDAGSSIYWQGVASVVVDGPGWSTLDAAAVDLTWTQLDGQTGVPTGVTANGTLSGLSSQQGGADSAYLGLYPGCGDEYFLDKYQVGDPGDVITFDLERVLTRVTMTASPATVPAGGSTTLSGVPSTAGGGGFAAVDLVLEAGPFGATAFTVVVTATSTSEGGIVTPARTTVRPQVQTAYRWILAEDQAQEGSASPVVVVDVRKTVTARAPRRATQGKAVTVTGRVAPAVAGIPVVLERRQGKRWVRWA